MAIYHCSCKVISRSSGRSAVGASAYRSGEKLENERDGIVHDYTHKSGVVYTEIMLSENAPEEWQDRSKLWNEVEKIEKAQDSRLSREYEIALPKELTREQQIECARNIAYTNFVVEGQCVDIAIHDKGDGNPHAHIMTTMRPIDEKGQWENKTEKLYLCKNAKGEEKAFTSKEIAQEENTEWKKQYHYSKDGNPKGKKVYLTEQEKESNPKYADYERIKGDKYPKSEKYGRQNPTIEKWNSDQYLQSVRASISEEINLSLERHGHEERVDHRSFKEQGIEQIPTIHLGSVANDMERKGKITEKGNINREIKRQNEQIKVLNAQVRELTISRIEVQTDIQIQNVHNEMQLYKAQIPQATKEQLESIQKSINTIDKKMEKIKDSGAYEGKEIVADAQGRIYIPKMEYEYKKYKKACSEITEMTEERKTYLVNTINKNLQEMKAKEQQAETKKEIPQPQKEQKLDLEKYVKEVSVIRKEYSEVQNRLSECSKTENTPRVTNEFSIAYNNAERCIQEINKNQAIFDKAKTEKGNLNLLQRTEKKACDSTMQKAQENINRQMETMNKLGIKDLSQAPAKMKEFELNDRKEKQTITTFNQTKADLQNRATQLENRFAEMKAILPPKAQEVIGELKTRVEGRADQQDHKGMSEWKKDMESNSQALDKLRAFEKSVGKNVEEKLQEQSKTQEVTRTR